MLKSPFTYRPYYQKKQLICGIGQIAIITGWTVKQSVASKLTAEQYAVIGNLYSPTRGISPMIRNLLANPHVRYLVILKATKEDQTSGSCQCFLDFFRQGCQLGKTETGKPCWVINSQITGYIDQEISLDSLKKLRQSVEYKTVNSIKETIALVNAIYKNNPLLESWSKPLFFPETKYQPSTFSGYLYGHRIQGKTIAETWLKILHRVKTIGTIRPTQYGQWQELIDLMAIVTDEPFDFYFPQPNYLPIDQAFIQNYISQILEDAPFQEGVKYTYGQRLRSWFKRDQIQQAIDKLITEKDSSRAVMSLWDVQDYESGDSPPCLNHIWLRIINNKLSLTATFRSNDMFSAWVANAMGLRALQQHICEQINQKTDYSLTLAPLITVSQSAHIYDDCWEYAEKLIETEYPKLFQKIEYIDPNGSFVIRLQNQRIIVEHLTPGSGEVVHCYRGKTARQIYQQIAQNCPTLDVSHALYLGTELQKAEIALSQNNESIYRQDQPLTSF